LRPINVDPPSVLRAPASVQTPATIPEDTALPARSFVEDLNRTYFDGRLSMAVLDRMALLPVERPDARAVIERSCRLMHRSALPAEDFSTSQGDMFGSLLSRLLPGN
jgi:hypothetical protein